MDITSSRYRKMDTLDVSFCSEVRDNEGQSTSTTHTDRPKELWFDPWLAAKGDTLREAVQNRRTSTIAATEWFVRLMAEKGVSEADFGRHKGQELIVLAKTERDFRRDAEGNYGPHKKSIWVDYRDTEETRAYRREMEHLNDFLDQADIEFIPDGLLPKVCPSERTLRRYFSCAVRPRKDAFQRNGRIFGGFWLNLKKGRRKNIRISGEPVALLDFSSMFVRLAYATVGQEPPQ